MPPCARTTRFDCSTFPTQIAAEVMDLTSKYLSAKEARRYDTFIHRRGHDGGIRDAGSRIIRRQARVGVASARASAGCR
jgi:hypothetical protein